MKRLAFPPSVSMAVTRRISIGTIVFLGSTLTVAAQEYGTPDRDAPGDQMIQDYLRGEAERIHNSWNLEASLDEWLKNREEFQKEYFDMLGLWPVPEKTPLDAKITGTLKHDGVLVDRLYFESRPQLYVTANLYRPEKIEPGQRLPAVLYVCGHAGRGRNGNKTAYQSHGIWLARHGYVCLMLDTLQLGEIPAVHHGTYREQRWWWHSRGYTPAGVECWNGIRGIDYLLSRDDVDPDRLAVTGISGGGAATFWIAAADERIDVAVPVSGMADLPSYVSNRVINGHCDCMFLYNTYQWPWARIAALIAPRPLLFVNSDADRIFPMDANERIINRLERVYTLYGAGDRVDSVVSIGGHAYREDIRRAEYRFINTYLKNDPSDIADSEVDLVTYSGKEPVHPIPPEQLRVFAKPSDVPADQLNTTIDEHFVPRAEVSLPQPGAFDDWKAELCNRLRSLSFRTLPADVPPAKLVNQEANEDLIIETEPGIQLRMTRVNAPDPESATRRTLLVIGDPEGSHDWASQHSQEGDVVYCLQVRGTGDSRWTTRNPPNNVERSHVLLGHTVDGGRVRDIIAAAKWLKAKHKDDTPLVAVGNAAGAILAAYAALWDPGIAEVLARSPQPSHMDANAPQLLSVLRVCDVPDILGMLAPRPLTLVDAPDDLQQRVRSIYTAAGSPQHLSGVPQ